MNKSESETETKFMGIDFGERRIGISVSDSGKKYSFNRDYLFNDKDLLGKLEKIIVSENVERIIIGYPVSLKNRLTDLTEKVDDFAEALKQFLLIKKLNVEIAFFDERFTSKIAERSLLISGIKKSKRKEKGLVDSISAQMILQDYLDRMNNSTSG
ncbi:MAG TPA: Holliday junction resolvase RuvX [Ignavibacteria bacterium]|nr:Holliday junction resolvase RuvX [Ignavibacteria bacterium]